MKKFDKIIGYESIKSELLQIADMYKNREVYTRLGANIPKGLLMYGVPGVGKSLMLSALVELIGVKCFVCRKDKPNDDFINKIREAFKEAAENEPSIVFLDDMDKYSATNEFGSYAEEYITVQSCIDMVADKDVFVIATANSIQLLPPSLTRSKRFDRVISVPTPSYEDARQIIEYYLSGMKVSHDMDIDTIAKIMEGRSCADLETIINEAGIYAGSDRSETIRMHHFMYAAMRIIFNIPYSVICNYKELDRNDKNLKKIAYHEAGHIVVRETLSPGSTLFATVYSDEHGHGGITKCNADHSKDPYEAEEADIMTALAGMAATEQILGIYDVGATQDLEDAAAKINSLISVSGIGGFGNLTIDFDRSNDLMRRQELVASFELEKYFRKAKKILAENCYFLESVANALITNKYLTAEYIRELRNESLDIPDQYGNI